MLWVQNDVPIQEISTNDATTSSPSGHAAVPSSVSLPSDVTPLAPAVFTQTASSPSMPTASNKSEVEGVGGGAVITRSVSSPPEIVECRARLQLIDFEYASWNYRAFELGNFLCETYIDNFATDSPTGFRIHREKFPTDAFQRDFSRRYLVAYDLLASSVSSPMVNGDETKCDQSFAVDDGDKSGGMLRELRFGILGSNLFWALWSVLQAEDSDIAWGYREYAEARFDEYFRLKREFSARMDFSS